MCTKLILNEITDKIVWEIKNNLGDKLDKIILFGSYARGDFDDESDIDIMALADISVTDANKIDILLTRYANHLGLEYDVVISLFVKDCKTFYKFLPADPFYKNVMKDGVMINA